MKRLLAVMVLGLGLLLPSRPILADEKPLGYVSLIQDILEFPGLNGQLGVYWDAWHYGEFALGGSAAFLTAFNIVDLRVGYIRHEARIWGSESWELPTFGLSAPFSRIGLKSIKLLEGGSLGIWIGKDWTKDIMGGGLNLVFPL